MAVGCDCLNILVFLVAETKGKLTGIAYYWLVFSKKVIEKSI